MKKHWNKETNKRKYERTKEEAKKSSFKYTDEELEHPYLDKLSHQTKSYRILRMITLAYYLGKMKGISEVDEGLTPINLSDDIEKIVQLGDE